MVQIHRTAPIMSDWWIWWLRERDVQTSGKHLGIHSGINRCPLGEQTLQITA